MRFADFRSATAKYEWREQDNAVARTIFISCALLCASSCAGAYSTEHFWMLVPSVFSSAGVPIAVGLLAFRGRAKAVPARYRLAGGDLEVEWGSNQIHFKRADLRSAWVERNNIVHILLTEGRDLVLDAGDADTAEALVTELGFAKEQSVLEMPLAGFVKTMAAQRFAAVALLPLAAAWLFAAFMTGVMAHKSSDPGDYALLAALVSFLVITLGASIALVTDLRARKVVVGSDGVRIPHKKRVLPYRDIERVEQYREGVRLRKRDGAFVDLPLFQDGGFPFETFVDSQDALSKRIESFKSGSERTEDELKFALLDRKAQPLSEWKKQLLSLAEPRAGYRVATLSAEDLERVISDSESPTHKRVAATVALSGLDRERAVEKIRVLVPTCADPALRVALERAASEAELDASYLDSESEREPAMRAGSPK